MATCVSNEKQIGLAVLMYTQDYDEKYPAPRLHNNTKDATGDFTNYVDSFTWADGILPYIKSSGVFSCPSNPRDQLIGTGSQFTNALGDGDRNNPKNYNPYIPVSYAFNSCAKSWGANNDPTLAWLGPASISAAALARPSDTLMIGEITWAEPDVHAGWFYQGECDAPNGGNQGPYEHMTWPTFPNKTGGKVNLIFFDGHVKDKTWAQTLVPLNTNNWQTNDPNPNPSNTNMNNAIPNCQGTQYANPPQCGY